MQREPGDGVEEQRLAERRPRARSPLQPDRRLHVDERQRDELGESARRPLLGARSEQVPRPVPRRLDVPEHDRHVRAQADAVRGGVNLEPLLGRDLVGADERAHLVVEDLGGGAGERAEPEPPQALEIVLDRQAERGRALPDLERREGVDVQIRELGLDRGDDVGVVVAREGGMDPTLEADLGRAALPGLARAADDLLERHEVRRAAQVGRELPLREGAEAAAEVADVRVLDVPGDDVGDLVAADLAAEPVGRGEDALPLLAAGRKSRTSSSSPSSSLVSSGSGSRATVKGMPPRSPGCQPSSRASPSESELRERRRQDLRREPLAAEEGRDRRAAAARARARASASPSASRSRSGHGASGFTWSIVTGETPPQSSMPASRRRGKSS